MILRCLVNTVAAPKDVRMFDFKLVTDEFLGKHFPKKASKSLGMKPRVLFPLRMCSF